MCPLTRPPRSGPRRKFHEKWRPMGSHRFLVARYASPKRIPARKTFNTGRPGASKARACSSVKRSDETRSAAAAVVFE
jgi:hypothetical protein